MVQALGLGLHLAQGPRPAMVMAASFDPEAGLSLTASLPQGALDPELDPHTLKPMVFAADVVFPSTPADGVLFEHGGSGIGTMLGLRDGGTTLRLKAGDGAANVNLTIAAILDVTDFPADDQLHTIVFDVRPQAAGRVRLWIDGVFKGEAQTSGGLALEQGKWSGGGTGGFSTGDNANMPGEPLRIAWPAAVQGALRMYVDQQVITS